MRAESCPGTFGFGTTVDMSVPGIWYHCQRASDFLHAGQAVLPEGSPPTTGSALGS